MICLGLWAGERKPSCSWSGFLTVLFHCQQCGSNCYFFKVTIKKSYFSHLVGQKKRNLQVGQIKSSRNYSKKVSFYKFPLNPQEVVWASWVSLPLSVAPQAGRKDASHALGPAGPSLGPGEEPCGQAACAFPGRPQVASAPRH